MLRRILGVVTLTEDELKNTTFYVIELFPSPQFVLNEDGTNMTFQSYDEAFAEAMQCQDGVVAIF